MNTPRKAPVNNLSGFRGPGETALLNRTSTDQRGTGRVNGPEKGYIRCERRYPDGRRRPQRSR